MTAVVGLDVSATCTGVACPDGTTLVVRPKKHPDPYGRLHDMALGVARLLDRHKAELAVLELHRGAFSGHATVRVIETDGLVRLLCWQRAIPWVDVSSSQLKRYATGKGNAEKPAMTDAAQREGGRPANHDEADAWWLWRIGRDHIDGVPRGPLADDRWGIQDALRWPALALTAGAAS